MSYGGDVNRGPFLNVIDWVFCSLALFFVTLRLVSHGSRHDKKISWGVDEALLVFPLALILARAIYISYCIHLGFGQHLLALLEVDPVQTVELSRLLVILEAISLWTWALPKLPVAILIYRVFGTYRRRVGVILFAVVGFLLAVVVVQTVVTFVKCTPIEKNWNPTQVVGTCWNVAIYDDIGYFAGALSAALDFGFAIYAISQVFTLQMEKSRKIMIAVSLGLGIPAGIVTCIKLSTLGTLDYDDVTFSTVSLEVWNSVESCALMVAASVPGARTLFVMMGQRIKDWTSLASNRHTTERSTNKQSELSNRTTSSKGNLQIQSTELSQLRSASSYNS
ncbi:hypothetical protein BD289DRAFT_292604 [Coniella lustricola]|uniref:Rhodopsin domain-containing protein n=1 Tax=Coniella lustricola TaxID=2025994 RepID=A0A2T3A580_9PEZI|nr:hypothetical protein BD289DRAFT_292604 [Coniella lustricola]